MGSLQQICLRWNNHQSNFPKVFDELLQNKDLVDVTLTCEGQSLDAHKVVLSACSPYFRKLFQNNPCKHPIVFMRDVKYSELEAIIEFMYKGEVNVAREDLTDFLRTAQSLQIKGLAEEKPANDTGASKDDGSSPRVHSNSNNNNNSNSQMSKEQQIRTLLQSRTSHNNLLGQPISKKPRLVPASPSITSSSSSKMVMNANKLHADSTAASSRSPPPLHRGNPSQQNKSMSESSQADSRSYSVKMEANNDDDDEESRDDDGSGEEQQGLDMLMESTLETGDEHYVVGESSDGMYNDKNDDGDGSPHHMLGASTSGLAAQLLQGEGAHMAADESWERSPRRIWSEEEMDLLLRLWSDPVTQEQLQSGGRNTHVFDNIAAIMVAHGYSCRPDQCRQKMNKLKHEYYQQRKEGRLQFRGRFKKFIDVIHKTLNNPKH